MIKSRSNPLVKLARSLRDRDSRAETGLFLVEGIHHVGELVEAGWEIEVILYDPGSLKSEFARGLLATYKGRQEPVDGGVMEYLSAKDNPAGILAVAHQRWQSLDKLAPVRRGVALVSPQDPGNVGTILRTMDASACDALFLLDGGADPYHPGAIRASMGAIFWKPTARASFNEFAAWARAQHIQLIGTTAHASGNEGLSRIKEPWILVLGSEQKGLSEDQLSTCDTVISLPMQGRVSSLNLAVAAGILLYRLTGLAGMEPRGSIEPQVA